MDSGKRKWIVTKAGAAEGERSAKSVVKSGYKEMFAMSVDEQGLQTTRVSYQLKGLWQDALTHKGTDYDTFETMDSGYMQDVGAPRVPQEGVYVAIPENAEVKEVKVVSKSERELDGEFNVLPAPKPVFEEDEEQYIPNKEIYESEDPFPGKSIDFIGTKRIGGRKVAHVLIYLFQYRPISKKISALESLELEVVYETKPGMDSRPRPRKPRKSPADKLVLDFQSSLDAEAGPPSDAVDSTNPEAENLRSADNEAEYLIITTEDLKDSMSNFVEAKSSMWQIMVVTVAEIRAEFPGQQVDVAIRDFLIYATENWSVPPYWVVLGGNIDKVPTHMQSDGGKIFPSDHYYADLQGDMCPDISVSRFPASTPSDMEKISNIAANYDQQGGDWRDKVLLTTFDRNDYNKCKDDIAVTIGSEWTVIKEYDGQATKQQVIDTINSGVRVINYRGHGSATEWQASNGLDNGDIPGLANGSMIPQVLSIACWNNQLDYDGTCFGVTWIADGKAITFLGASRPSYTSINHEFDKYMWDGIINDGITQAGNIFNWGTTKLFLNNPGPATRHNIYMYLLLGDPSADYL